MSLLDPLNGQRHRGPLRLLSLHPRHLNIRKLPYDFVVRERELEVVQEHCDDDFYEIKWLVSTSRNERIDVLISIVANL